MTKDETRSTQGKAFTLWDLLTLLSWSGAMAGAVSVAGTGEPSALRLVILVAWGFVLGVGCVACARVGGQRLAMWALAKEGEFWASVVYLVLLAWIFASFGLSLLASRLVLRLLS